MLSNFFKSKLLIYAPLNGEIIPIEEVPDPVFSQKMMGEGLAIIPIGGKVHSPIEGTVILLSDNKHAIGLRSKNGTEILIHIGNPEGAFPLAQAYAGHQFGHFNMLGDGRAIFCKNLRKRWRD